MVVAEDVADQGEEQAGHVGRHRAGRPTADPVDAVHPETEAYVH